MIYLKQFDNHNAYTAYTADTENFVKPNVSYCVEENEVHMTPSTPPTPPIPSQLRIIANYNFEGELEYSSRIMYGFDGDYVDEMYFDGVKLEGIEYDTEELGEHTVEFVLKEGITELPQNAFLECVSLTSVTLPYGLTSIGDCAFMHHNSDLYVHLTSVTIPNTVTSIGDSAFHGCMDIVSVNIPNSVTSINDDVFYACSGLTSVTIPNSVTSIGNGAFGDCESLTSITIPNSVTSIDDRAFYGCTALTSITIPNGVTSIGHQTFSGCTSLISVVIPDSVTSIDDEAFYVCSSLTSITIPSGVTSIGYQAFGNCNGLTSITCLATTAPTIDNMTFYYVKANGTLYVPIGSSGYDVWMGAGNYYLGKYNWMKIEQ